MKRFRLFTLGVVALVMTAGASLAPNVHRAHAASLAGTWTYLNTIGCTRTPANADLCDLLLGPSSVTKFINGMRATCDAAGKCAYNSYFIAVGTALGLGPLCSPDVFDVPYNGACAETERGKIEIAGPPSATGLPDFMITDEYANFYGNPPLLNVHDPAGAENYPLDIANPAVPGVYSAQRYLVLCGLLQPGQPVPAGVSFSLVVTHVA